MKDDSNDKIPAEARALANFEEGLALFRERKPKEAIACFEKVLEDEPEDTAALNLLGQAYNEAGEQEKAIASLNKALKINPDYSLGYYDLGTILAKTGKRAEALVCLEKYLELQPSEDGHMTAWALYSIACLHALDGRKEEALNFFERALKEGLREREHIEKDTDLDTLRGDPRFISLMKEYFQQVSIGTLNGMFQALLAGHDYIAETPEEEEALERVKKDIAYAKKMGYQIQLPFDE